MAKKVVAEPITNCKDLAAWAEQQYDRAVELEGGEFAGVASDLPPGGRYIVEMSSDPDVETTSRLEGCGLNVPHEYKQQRIKETWDRLRSEGEDGSTD